MVTNKHYRNFTFRNMAYSGIAIAAAIVILIAWMVWDSGRAASQQAEQHVDNLAIGLERDIVRAIDNIDLSLQSTVRGMRLPGLAAMEPETRQAVLFGGAISATGFGGISVADAEGDVIYSSHTSNPAGIRLSDREYFQMLRDRDDLGLVTSSPLQSRQDGDWSLDLARRINGPNKVFTGVAVGSLKLAYVQELFSTLRLGKHGSAALFSLDGILLARDPRSPLKVGTAFAGGKSFQSVVQALSGTFEGTSDVDGIQRFYGYRRVGSLPLVLTVGLASSDIYAEWTQKTVVLSLLLCVLGLLGTLMVIRLGNEFKRRAVAESTAQRSEGELGEALARMGVLFENSKDAMFVARLHRGGFVYESANPVWADLTGKSVEASLGRRPSECLPAQIATIVDAGWAECVSSCGPVQYQYTIDLEGNKRDWDVLIAPVLDANRRVTRLIGVARDMTATHELEAQLRQSQKMEAVGQLTAGIAHDFNNMLQVIMFNLELLEEQNGLNVDGFECIKFAEQAARNGATMVHGLLAFSSKQALKPKLLWTELVARNIASLMARTLGSRVHVETIVADNAWAVHADEAQLDSCLLNLALNARDAMPDGGAMRLRVVNENAETAKMAGMPDADYVRFSVEDEGSGMDPLTLSRAFEPFFTTKGVGKGTGLGLSMVHGFARQSGGDARIESVLGQGTTVSIWLPRRRAATSGERIHLKDQPKGWRGKILIVDDEPSVRVALSTVLARAGYSTYEVESGEKALDLLHAGIICDLLITDRSMPGISGIDLIKAVRQFWPTLPTLMITGYVNADDLEVCDDRVTVLYKPITSADLLHRVEALLGGTTPTAPIDKSSSAEETRPEGA